MSFIELTLVWHKVRSKEEPIRIELSNNGLQDLLLKQLNSFKHR